MTYLALSFLGGGLLIGAAVVFLVLLVLVEIIAEHGRRLGIVERRLGTRGPAIDTGGDREPGRAGSPLAELLDVEVSCAEALRVEANANNEAWRRREL